MRKALLFLCVSLIALNGCSRNQKEKLGIVNTGPDEFMVVTREPLTLPPDYDLRPVNPNMSKDNAVPERNSAGMSVGEKRLLEKVDAN